MITEHDGRHLLGIACDAVNQASELVRTRSPGTLTKKGDRDLTSEVDLAVEKLVRNFLHVKTPEAAFLGEEEGTVVVSNDFLWILDPVDGTINLVHGLPLSAVSLSLVRNGIVQAAVIDLPFIRTRYTALRGYGSYANAKRIHVSRTTTLNTALISLDQYTFNDSNADHENRARLRLAEHLACKAQRVRMFGTSAVELAWMAEGRLDACVMLGNKPWDTSAGVLIAREAGARVLDQDGTDHSWNSAATIAVTPAVETQLITVVQKALAEPATT